VAQLSDECEGASSPYLPSTSAAPSLTAREMEVTMMAAGGWTSAAIARELVLSVRTVESHLYRAFAKLGVRSREELGQALRRTSA
jgi:DNA-binding CsgD family transcriptional regulator